MNKHDLQSLVWGAARRLRMLFLEEQLAGTSSEIRNSVLVAVGVLELVDDLLRLNWPVREDRGEEEGNREDIPF